MARAYLSLGSNVDPEPHLRAALRALRERFGALDVSPAYRSAAVGFAGPPFLNCAAACDCDIDRAALRDWLHRLEAANGRDRSRPRYADRTLDLDLALWCEGAQCVSDCTREEFERAYVLAPLADLAPDLREPFTGAPIGARWRALEGHLPQLERAALALWP